MSTSHIKTAHTWGVEQALTQAGYSSYNDLVKEAEELGLIEKTAANYGGLGAALGGLLDGSPVGSALGAALGAEPGHRAAAAAGAAGGNILGGLGGYGLGKLLGVHPATLRDLLGAAGAGIGGHYFGDD